MNKYYQNKLGINLTSILIPKHGTNMEKWAVVACDQYTSEPEYWQQVEDIVGNAPSTLHLVFPEVYLERENRIEKQKRISCINQAMCDYLDEGYFCEITQSMIYTERTTQNKNGFTKTRKGLVFSIDLENYDYSVGSQTLIRATEGTILDRLPPRIKIREKACLELPHIMLLIDDDEQKTIEPLSLYKNKMKSLYSFDLMMNGGHLEGYQVSDENLLKNVFQSLLRLKSPEVFREKYAVNSSFSPLLFAVGDGNHSLATAKACWEQIKPSLSKEEQKNHPSRFALIELVNVHDKGLEFEPIHRVLFQVNASELLSSFVDFYNKKGICCGFETVTEEKMIPHRNVNRHIIPFVTHDKTGYIWVEHSPCTLDVGTLQCFLDTYLKNNEHMEIDYVHGEDVTQRLGKQVGNMGFLLSPMKKEDLFKTVILDGVLPRKAFSMGEAEEKRFYLECRSLTPDRVSISACTSGTPT